MQIYALADRLHKSAEEIESLSVYELRNWFAYLRILAKRDKK